jgi:hypothetical protein
MMGEMTRSTLALTIMALAPPAVLLTYMHIYSGLAGPASRAGWLTAVVMMLAVISGLGGVASSGWSRRAKVWTAIGYLAAAIPLAPALTLAAQCTTGDCI